MNISPLPTPFLLSISLRIFGRYALSLVFQFKGVNSEEMLYFQGFEG